MFARLLLAGLVLLVAESARADFVVLTNRCPEKIACTVETGKKSLQFSIEPGETRPLRASGDLTLAIGSREQVQRYALDLDSAYYFAKDRQGKVSLERIGLGDGAAPATARPQPGKANQSGLLAVDPLVVPVKILVDDDENAVQAVWEKRLRSRVEAASKITEQHAFVRFKVVAVGTWKSDNKVNDFARSLTEFEQAVDPAPARLAIGFTSQYQLVRGRTHLGGTHGPLVPHLLLREWSQHVTEPERLELLLHELGHYLGAVHSPEQTSVMRPVLGDRVARAASFRIGFDPVNTLAMCLVGEDLRRRPIGSLAACSERTQHELRSIYRELGRTMPNDSTAARYLGALAPVQVIAPAPRIGQ